MYTGNIPNAYNPSAGVNHGIGNLADAGTGEQHSQHQLHHLQPHSGAPLGPSRNANIQAAHSADSGVGFASANGYFNNRPYPAPGSLTGSFDNAPPGFDKQAYFQHRQQAQSQQQQQPAFGLVISQPDQRESEQPTHEQSLNNAQKVAHQQLQIAQISQAFSIVDSILDGSFSHPSFYGDLAAVRNASGGGAERRGQSFSAAPTQGWPFESSAEGSEPYSFPIGGTSIARSASTGDIQALRDRHHQQQHFAQDSGSEPSPKPDRGNTRASLPFATSLKAEPGLSRSMSGKSLYLGVPGPSSVSDNAQDEYEDSFDTNDGDMSLDSNGIPMGCDGQEPEVFQCPHCDKAYRGKHARSIWRRHLQDKHAIPLSLQPRRTRWDGDANRPKNAEERRARMLESKRRWARKKRQQDKAVSLGLPPDAEQADINKRLIELPSAEYARIMEEDAAMPYYTQATFAVGSRTQASDSSSQSVARNNSRAVGSAQQRAQAMADEAFFRQGGSSVPSSVSRSSYRVASPASSVSARPSASGGHPIMSSQPQRLAEPDVFEPTFAPSARIGFALRGMDPNVTPVQHFAMLQPTPPSTGPSSAEKEMHALKHKMLASMYGPKYKPLPSPPTSNDKGKTVLRTVQTLAPPMPPSAVDRQPHEDANEAASNLLSLADSSPARDTPSRDDAASKQAPDSPTRSPLASRADSLWPMRSDAPTRASSAAPRESRNNSPSQVSSPRRHSAVERRLVAGKETSPTTLRLSTRPPSERGNPFSLEQHRISPAISRRGGPSLGMSPAHGLADGLPMLSPLRRSHDAPALLGLSSTLASKDIFKLPPLVATPARDLSDIAHLKRRAAADLDNEGDMGNNEQLKKPRLGVKDENFSPPRSDVRATPARPLFTPFHKATGGFPELRQSALRPTPGLLGSVTRSRRSDQFSSPLHLGLTSSLGLAPSTGMRNSNDHAFEVETPAPMAKKEAIKWPSTVLKGANLSQGSRATPEISSLSEEEEEEAASSQRGRLNHNTTPSKRSGSRMTKSPQPLNYTKVSSPLEKKVASVE